MPSRLLLSLVALVALVPIAFGASGCSTVIKPTRPTDPLAEIGDVAGFRFEGEQVTIREPGTPLSPSRAWQREVANYTARSLNTLLSTPEDAPVVRTTVTFDLGAPGVLQIGTWKSMDIVVTSVLPDGRVVRSEAVTGNIDDPLEYAGYTALGVCGTIIDVGVGIFAMVSLFGLCGPPPLGVFTLPVIIGGIVAGLSLNLAQSGAQYLIAASEETRWSNLFATALKQHADDILAGRGTRPTTAPPTAPPTGAPPPTTTTPVAPPPPGAEPPPPLLDPAEKAPSGQQPAPPPTNADPAG